jgi:ABC-type transport system involved in multi-copper enzyme maturation permease subunit
MVAAFHGTEPNSPFRNHRSWKHAQGQRIMDLWPNFLGLLIITLVLGSLSVWRFRKQLS